MIRLLEMGQPFLAYNIQHTIFQLDKQTAAQPIYYTPTLGLMFTLRFGFCQNV